MIEFMIDCMRLYLRASQQRDNYYILSEHGILEIDFCSFTSGGSDPSVDQFDKAQNYRLIQGFRWDGRIAVACGLVVDASII
jgi:hypothetical protein